MTVGLDVEMLFPDMIMCMNTPDIELKKLVYLYIINYARVKRNRDTVLLAVNTFVQVQPGAQTDAHMLYVHRTRKPPIRS